MFENIKIKRCYRTKKDNLDKDFFIPLLKESCIYDRGTGFFSVNGLSELATGLIPYIKNGGNIRIITSVELDFNEIEIIDRSISIMENELTENILSSIENELLNNEYNLDVNLICNLIAANILQIKIAFLPDGGIYHEKMGFFEDGNGNGIWFNGSNNETYGGLKKNVECLTVLKSWEGDFEEIDEQKAYFNNLWNNNDDDIKVFSFPDAAKNKLFSKYRCTDNVADAIYKIEERYANASKKKLYPYQQIAVNEFVNNRYCHFFEMATGTGKTFTAIKAVERMSLDMQDKPLYVVVLVPQIDLQTQWAREFREIGIKPYCFGGNATSSNWESDFDNSIIDYYSGKKVVVSICIYDTYFSKIYNQIETKRINKLIIVDEAHELSFNQFIKLSDSYKFRLGLSATPERYNPSETKSIIDYFTRGNIETFKYTIEDAIQSGFLSKYYYYPISIHLENNESEFSLYQSYTKKIAQLMNEEEPDKDKIQEYRNNRSLIIKKATNKLHKLKTMISSKEYDFKNSVIYCGQGKDLDTEESIIDNVSKAMLDLGNYKVSQFTSKTIDRQRVLEEFENAYYDTLIAIRCFDQGVDVPKLDKIYIMASDGSTRQTVQRRGRVLRKCKETGKTVAYIFDMVTLPPEGIYSEMGAASLVARELNRVKEYGRLAINNDSVERFINMLINDYGITEESDDEKEIDY